MMNKKISISVMMLLLMLQIALATHEGFEHKGQVIFPNVVSINGALVSRGQVTFSDQKIEANKAVRVILNPETKAKDGCKRIEVGIYNLDLAEQWYGSIGRGLAIINQGVIPNCVTDEKNVQTREICTSGSKSTKDVEYVLIAPNFDSNEKYALVAASYECCWNDVEKGGQYSEEKEPCSETGITNKDWQIVQLTNTVGGTPAANCNDGLKDQDETDIDCGGNTCSDRCEPGQVCKQAADCTSGKCSNGKCESIAPITQGDNTLLFVGGGLILIGIVGMFTPLGITSTIFIMFGILVITIRTLGWI